MASEGSTDQWGWLAVVICTSYVVASHTNATRTALGQVDVRVWEACGWWVPIPGKIGKYWRDHRSGRTVQIVVYFLYPVFRIVRGLYSRLPFPRVGTTTILFGFTHPPLCAVPCVMLSLLFVNGCHIR